MANSSIKGSSVMCSIKGSSVESDIFSPYWKNDVKGDAPYLQTSLLFDIGDIAIPIYLR